VRYLASGSTAFGVAFISSAANLAGFVTPRLIGYVREASRKAAPEEKARSKAGLTIFSEGR